jgi:hypothetical protein
MVPANSKEILRKLWKQFGWNEVGAFFRAEYEMDQDVWIFMSHQADMHILRPGVCDECTTVSSRNGTRSNVELRTRHFQGVVRQKVSSGRYTSASDVVNAKTMMLKGSKVRQIV